MPKKLPKSLQDYISKIKKPTTPHFSTAFSSSKNWILSGCKHHPRTLSFAVDPKQEDQPQDQDDDSATLSDIDRFLFENFKSLYIKDNEDEENGGVGKERRENDGIALESPRFVDPPTDLCGSHRFLVAPGLSGSLIEDTRSSLTGGSSYAGSAGSSSSIITTVNNSTPRSSNAKDAKDVALPDDFIAVLTYSPSPHDDFGRSMHEMVEARLRHHEKVDWSFMEELLFSYLNVNEKKSHKYILSAFVDLIVVLRQKSNRVPARSSRNVRSTRGRRKKIRHVT
ncbi:hypothetical protein FNV43_RR06859 [Rhamnella rubrinervis]|uniref:Transcription repressor n=1 Tax=Rhamnella rubrinervis TaxID=2594499 RepID=A0A8K0MMD6_9ROSA|nr:hypothetical protein FNV43_RR06859 [Rhamnella rubrinervis]